MPWFLERAGSARTKCQICGEAIAKTVLRGVDETTYYIQDEERTRRTYAHLVCLVDIQRHDAHAALIATRTTDEIYREACETIDEKLALATRPQRHVPVKKQAVAPPNPRIAELLVELEASPRDRDLLTVLADMMQTAGDERGELIMLDLNPSTDTSDVEAISRRGRIASALAPKLVASKATWGIGFYRKLHVELTELAALATALAHPTCRLLEILEIVRAKTFELSSIPLPRSLRSLRIHGELVGDLTALPHLEELYLCRAAKLAHPKVRSIELEYTATETLDALAPHDLPSLVDLSIARHNGDDAIERLAERGWFARLTRFSASYMVLGPPELGILEKALHGRRLERLEIKGTGLVREDQPRLAKLCHELDFMAPRGPKATTDRFVEHTKQPAWGKGKIVREYDGKIDVEFASGKRTFKADAPFLKRT